MATTPETIAQKLDRLYPALCADCQHPYKRTERKWIRGMSRNICSQCGLDQASAEAYAYMKFRSG